MTDAKLTALSFRLLGLWCLTRIIEFIGPALAFGLSDPTSRANSGIVLSSYIPVVSYLIVGLAMVFWADSLAAKIAPVNETVIAGNSAEMKQWYLLGFSLLGAWLVVATVPANVANLIVQFSLSGSTMAGFAVHAKAGAWSLLALAGTQLVMGIYLIFGKSHLYGLIIKEES